MPTGDIGDILAYLDALRAFEQAHRADVQAMTGAGTTVMAITAASMARRKSLRRLRAA